MRCYVDFAVYTICFSVCSFVCSYIKCWFLVVAFDTNEMTKQSISRKHAHGPYESTQLKFHLSDLFIFLFWFCFIESTRCSLSSPSHHSFVRSFESLFVVIFHQRSICRRRRRRRQSRLSMLQCFIHSVNANIPSASIWFSDKIYCLFKCVRILRRPWCGCCGFGVFDLLDECKANGERQCVSLF